MAVNADTRQRMTEVSALITRNHVQKASEYLFELIKVLPPGELMLVSPGMKVEIERLQKRRRRDLLLALDSRLTQLTRSNTTGKAESTVRNPLSQLAASEPLSKRVGVLLKKLADNHIFKWTPHYRDTLQLIFAEVQEELSNSVDLDAEIGAIGNFFTDHAEEIFRRGYAFQTGRGLLPDVAETKSIVGLQAFLDVVVSVYLDRRMLIARAKDAEVLWTLISTLATSIVRGYGKVQFGPASGWSLLAKNMRIWVSPIGFCRGSELQSLFDDFASEFRDEELYLTVTAATLAIERAAHRFRDDDVLLPRLSRMSIRGPARLDLTLSAKQGGYSRDLLLTCFWHGSIYSEQPIRSAELRRSAVVIGRMEPRIQAWIEQEQLQSVVDTTGVQPDHQQIHQLSELICGKLEARGFNIAEYGDPSAMTHNFAKDFPLDDPDFRRQFMVERHSVKRLLQDVEEGVGIHLWCSVRRSGKTTAALELADTTGQAVVVMQTMDHQPRHPIQNIFSRRLREVFTARREISEEFFLQVVNECTLAATPSDSHNRRIVFIIDEYETLFALIDDYVREDPGLKVRVALPLLSQMVDFATGNLLIFMGQRPDAYQILSSQNQLSPLVQQYNFPLFDHINDAKETEFVQFLAHVLSEKLPFDAAFANAVFEETRGHPYLTVNLMVDFCDWLIDTNFRLGSGALSALQFANFTRDRLTPAALKRSPHYEFFHAMMAEYLSERARKEEPWLSAIAHILRAIAQKHPRTFSCAVGTYEKLAAPMGEVAGMHVARLLTTGCLANFLRDSKGSVSPGVKLLSRLAGSTAPTIN